MRVVPIIKNRKLQKKFKLLYRFLLSVIAHELPNRLGVVVRNGQIDSYLLWNPCYLLWWFGFNAFELTNYVITLLITHSIHTLCLNPKGAPKLTNLRGSAAEAKREPLTGWSFNRFVCCSGMYSAQMFFYCTVIVTFSYFRAEPQAFLHNSAFSLLNHFVTI